MYSAYSPNQLTPISRPHVGRQGRAICRLLFAHGRTVAEVAGIAEVSQKTVKKCIQNDYAKKDVISEDYHYAGKNFLLTHNITPPSREGQHHNDETPSVRLLSHLLL